MGMRERSCRAPPVARRLPVVSEGEQAYCLPAIFAKLETAFGNAGERRSAALIGLIIILALAIAGVVLVRELRERSRLEDCLMSGRTNCAPIEVPQRR